MRDIAGGDAMPDKKAYIRLEMTIAKEGKDYSAFCDELGLATCGITFEEAEHRLNKITIMTLNAATKRGEIEALLKERGIPLYFTEAAIRRAECATNIKPGQWTTTEVRELAFA